MKKHYAHIERCSEYEDRAYFLSLEDPLDVDFFIVSLRGESSLCELLEQLKKDGSFENIKNLLYKKSGQWEYTGEKEDIFDIESEGEIIDWAHLDAKYLFEEISLRGSFGCRMKCNFCDYSVYSLKALLKSNYSLLKELQDVASRKKVKKIYFVDDNLFYKFSDFKHVLQMMIKAKLNLEWEGFVRPDFIDEETAVLLRDSGSKRLWLGAESSDVKILKNMGKNLHPDVIEKAVRLLNQQGINTVLHFILGYPGETLETMKNTVSFINRLNDSEDTINTVAPFVFNVLPFSFVDSENERNKHGLKGLFYGWEHSTMDSRTVFESLIKWKCSVKYERSIFKAMYSSGKDAHLSLSDKKKKYRDRMKHIGKRFLDS